MFEVVAGRVIAGTSGGAFILRLQVVVVPEGRAESKPTGSFIDETRTCHLCCPCIAAPQRAGRVSVHRARAVEGPTITRPRLQS